MADKNETSREVVMDVLKKVVLDENYPEVNGVEKEPKGITLYINDSRYFLKEDNVKTVGELTCKVDVDISEALTGLKALQREAKKAAKELRELESSSQVLRELEEAPQFNLANIIANSLPISTEDAEKVVEAIMQGRHRNGHVFPADKDVNHPTKGYTVTDGKNHTVYISTINEVQGNFPVRGGSE
ncbi:Uncharacterised protein [Niallia circulans]|uniref:hypothetical protein n=1 Tax=Niallia circulans TaxID=1397 RepID=UPI00077C5854|nr:hypothetical protein [Niallia circulans]MDR4318692.1 hypothetical protein [Niallia circulans]MED3839347.1 hypothetical protein [Niallia circulans]MED4245330.1 hypothetical protein [Niallia circulans]MED4250865.1 hypothetical protein [Niallia circulans]QKH60145.1 hypothetical protein FOC77_05505 [Niallia circulans]